MPANPTAGASVYQLKITLLNVRPPVWRRVEVSGDISLSELHHVIQIAMGWQNSHLHCFRTAKGNFSIPYKNTDFEISGDKDSSKVRLDTIGAKAKSKFMYEYDFGDGWMHKILVEKITKTEEGEPVVACVAGKRACPPEDCGGAWRYGEFVEAMADAGHQRHKESRDWFGDDWDPEAFDLEGTHKRLAAFFREKRRKR